MLDVKVLGPDSHSHVNVKNYLSRRDFLKLAGITGLLAFLLTSCGVDNTNSSEPIVVRHEPYRTPEVLPKARPNRLTNQYYLDGRRLKFEEINNSIPDFALDFVNRVGSEQHDIVVEMFTNPQNPNNPDDPNRVYKAVTIKVPKRAYLTEAHFYHDLYVKFADKREFEGEGMVDIDSITNYRETFYDPKSNQIYTIERRNIPQTNSPDGILHEIFKDPDTVTNEILDDSQYSALLKELQKKAIKRRIFTINKKVFNPDTNTWEDKQVITLGSLWHTKFVNFLTNLLQGKSNELDQEKANTIINDLLNKPFPEPNSEFDYDQIFTSLFQDKEAELAADYLNYFTTTIPDPNKRKMIFYAAYNFLQNQEGFNVGGTEPGHISVTQFAELVELLSFKEDFAPDFNYNGELFKNMIVDMLLPSNLKSQRGLLFNSIYPIAGWVPVFDSSSEENVINQDVPRNVRNLTEDTVTVHHAEPILIGITKLVPIEGQTVRRYDLGYYDYRTMQFKVLKGDLEDKDFENYNPAETVDFNNPWNIFLGEKTRIGIIMTNDGEQDQLEDFGIIRNGNDGSIITDAVMIKPGAFSRRKTDWKNSANRIDYGFRMKRRVGSGMFDDGTLYMNEILFPEDEDNFIDKVFGTNNKEVQPKQGDWITEVTDLYLELRKAGKRIFSNIAFNGIGDLVNKLLLQGKIYSQSNPDLNLSTISGSYEDPNQLLEFLKKMYGHETTLAIVARNTPVYSNIPDPNTGSNLVQYLSPGDFVVVEKIINGSTPYALVKRQQENSELYYIPLKDLLLDKADTNWQKAAIVATIIITAFTFAKITPSISISAETLEFIGNLSKAFLFAFGSGLQVIIGEVPEEKELKKA